MDSALQAFKDEWEAGNALWHERQQAASAAARAAASGVKIAVAVDEVEVDRSAAKRLARAYVESRPELEDQLGDKSLEELVKMVDEARSNFDETRRLILDIWLLDQFAPQSIGANVRLVARRRGGVK